ncbi:Late expression factor 4 [Lonomia obliqua multiple nucleopolyhedrovirus]|uniref:Late expression factor 4 n=1 Tax=Lonomia obliqua multiple nucleopolyhedrovirus TaxID=134394 RepID=A0A126FCG7_9ABAC|nr:Late expression factor 4 [Lonomia obliqua multiple nucleopolyhedrovirus]AKN81045.1 Late expression factor 4 [Lonomia obliqua multiple nucleopolyhedrovirus]
MLSDSDDFVVEKEISYSINFSQDVLYKILDSYIVTNYHLTQQYCDLYDENDVRTRIFCGGNTNTNGDDHNGPNNSGGYDDNGQIISIKKTQLKYEKFAHWCSNTNILVPFVWRESKEHAVSFKNVSQKLHKIIHVFVYVHENVEIKFEQVYLWKSCADFFDSMTANKVVKLLNLLENSAQTYSEIMQNSQLGSDEILCRIRLEYEFDTATPNVEHLNGMCQIIVAMEQFSDHQNISPCLPYTALLDKIILRKFEHEQKISYSDKQLNNNDDLVKKWAFKLDGVRGRGLFIRNFCLIQTDDMKFYSTKLAKLFKLNNIVTFQCEIMETNQIFITDLLQIFKYKYNNRTQYECVTNSFYAIDPMTAIECINYFNVHVKSIMLTDTKTKYEMLFQKFFDPPLCQSSYSTFAVDGYIILDSALRYVKYKWNKTIELEYDERSDMFNSLSGPLSNHAICANDISLKHGSIYECALFDNVIKVLKHRPDRLVPN